MADERLELGRRQFVVTVGVAAGVAATASATGVGRSAAQPVAAAGDEPEGVTPGGAEGEVPAGRETTVEPEVTALFGDIRAGTRLDRWVVESVHPIRLGAIPVVLRTADGSRFQVDVLRRDDAGPRGVANTTSLSVFVSNRGDGAKATDEEQGLGAMALASALAEREAAGARAPALSTLRERRQRHPLGGYSVLV